MISKIIFYNPQLLLLLIYLVPVLVVILFVASFSVNVPFWDQWDLVKVFEKIFTGTASIGDFFAQHNEHRIAFPKMIMATLAFITKWDIRYELYFSILLAVITFHAIYKIYLLEIENERTISNNLTNILTCILIFSLVQYENWLWGFQIAWFLINACFAIAVLIIALSTNYPKRLYLAAIPCFIASFSSAHGLLSWLALIPSVASVNGSSRQRRIRIVIWILLFAATCGIYLIGYQKPSHNVNLLFFLEEPLVAGNYFFTLLGTPLVDKSIISPVIGMIIFLIFLFLTAHFVKKNKQKFQVNSKMAPWISIGLFALLFALMTTVGRASLGVEQAMSSRYTTSSVLLVISIAHLWRIIYFTNSFIAGIITGLILINSVDVIPQAGLLQLQRQASTTCLELVNFIDKSSDSCLGGLYPSTSIVRERAPILEKLGFRKFPKDIAFITKPAKVHGYIDSPPTGETPFTLSKSESLNAAGWAILPDSSELPKTVLLSYGSNRSFFANALVNLDSFDVAKALNSSRFNKVRWSVNISPKSLPLGDTVIKAWVYDSSGKQFVKLNGEPKVKVVE